MGWTVSFLEITEMPWAKHGIQGIVSVRYEVRVLISCFII